MEPPHRGVKPSRIIVGGLVTSTELAIPGAAPAPADSETDVEIRFGAVTDPPDLQPTGDGYSAVGPGGDVLLTIPDAARFLVSAGRCVVIEPANEAVRAEDLLVFLLGSVFGVLFYQRGTIPLHATSLRIGCRAVLLCGDSGAGKSTLGQRLAERGHELVADDVTPVTVSGQETPLCWPLVPLVKLWGDAAEALGIPVEGLGTIRPGIPKYRVGLPVTGRPDPVALGLVVVLSDGDDDQPQVEELRGLAAVGLVHRQFYRPWIGVPLLGRQACMLAAMRMAAKARVFALARRKGFDRLDDLAALVEALSAQSAATSRDSPAV